MAVRITEAMAALVCERGFAGATLRALCERAKVSQRTFYEVFASREDCFLAILDAGHATARELIEDAFARCDGWREGVRAALAELLLLFDREPTLARVWLVESLAAGSWSLRRRELHNASLTRMIVAHWEHLSGDAPHPLAADATMISVLGILQSHLLGERSGPLVDLLGPLMAVITAPYLEPGDVGRELVEGHRLASEKRVPARPRARAPATAELPDAVRDPRARRARECLAFLARNPGASNREVASAVGIASHAQTSELLRRLARAGLLDKRPGAPGHPNAWRPTPLGNRAAAALAGDG